MEELNERNEMGCEKFRSRCVTEWGEKRLFILIIIILLLLYSLCLPFGVCGFVAVAAQVQYSFVGRY